MKLFSVPDPFLGVTPIDGHVGSRASVADHTPLFSGFGAAGQPAPAPVRRASSEVETPFFSHENAQMISIDSSHGVVVFRGKSVSLTSNEFKLLQYLRSRSDPVGQEELGRQAFGTAVTAGAVRFHVCNLRRKLDEVGIPGNAVIETWRGRGYRFAPDAV